MTSLLPDTDSPQLPLDAHTTHQLVRRLDLWSQLLRRQEEEAIAALVPVESEWVEAKRQELLGQQPLQELLEQRRCSADEFELHLWLPEALLRFAEARYGPGLEEEFLSAGGGHDQIIYSLLRVRDVCLARELWIRLEEGEALFSELASAFGEGPEASHKGLIGPMPLGSLQPPELAAVLRALRPGETPPPLVLGEWQVLLRLEQLQPARFDQAMRRHLLEQQLNALLETRVRQRLAGEAPEELTYDCQL